MPSRGKQKQRVNMKNDPECNWDRNPLEGFKKKSPQRGAVCIRLQRETRQTFIWRVNRLPLCRYSLKFVLWRVHNIALQRVNSKICPPEGKQNRG